MAELCTQCNGDFAKDVLRHTACTWSLGVTGNPHWCSKERRFQRPLHLIVIISTLRNDPKHDLKYKLKRRTIKTPRECVEPIYHCTLTYSSCTNSTCMLTTQLQLKRSTLHWRRVHQSCQALRTKTVTTQKKHNHALPAKHFELVEQQ